MKVLKRNGSVEEYNPGKLRIALANTSDGANRPFTEGDLGMLLKGMEELLREKTQITSKQLYVLTVGLLYAEGFEAIAKAYTGYEDNAWKSNA